MANGYQIPFSFDADKIPNSFRFAVNIIFCMYCEDMFYYWTHRILMHWGPTYPYIHKTHHSYKETIGLATEYTHPIDYVLNALPTALSCAVLGQRMHFTSLLSFTFLRVWETFDFHSGFEIPWSPYRILPFASSAEYHDFHHSHNVGNYASMFSIWDTVYGTNKDFYAYYSKLNDKKED